MNSKDDSRSTAEVPTAAATRASVIRRFFNAWRRWEKHMDYGPYDYMLDRIGELESRLSELELAMDSVTHHNPAFLFDMSAGGFAQISVAEPGRMAFLSGQVAGAPNGEYMPPDLASQAQIIAAHLTNVLTDLGASANDIVMIRLYVVNATKDRFQQALTALRDTFSGGKPSITTIGVQALYTPEYQLEVEMVVRVP